MKRIANYLIALAVAAFTFTSCSDVPSPFGDIIKPATEEAVTIEPIGSGTEADPYNVAALLEFVSGLGADTPSNKEVFFKGYVTETTDISAQYGNATFYISDTEDGTANKFYVYRAKGLGGDNVTDEKFLKEGDFVVMCGKVTNYKGNTPETVQGAAYVVSINGEGGGGTKPEEETKTVSVADFLKAAESTSVWYQLTGTVKNLKDGDLYGNFDLEDATGSVYVYGLLSEKGGEKKLFQELAAAKGIKNGSKLTIIGNRGAYNGNAQVTNAYFVSVEAGDAPADNIKGTGTLADPFNIAAAIAKCKEVGETASTEKYYIKGIVVKGGKASGGYGNVTFKLGDSKDDTELFTAYQVAGTDGEKLADGFEVKEGDEVVIYGPVVNYKGNTPETTGKSAAQIVTINGKKTSEGASAANDGSQSKPFNIAEAIAKCKEVGETASTEKYYIKGIVVKGGKASGGYGNVTFKMGDSKDDTELFTAYQVAGTDGEKLADGFEVKEGDEVIVYGPIMNYKGNTPETAGKSAAQIVTINGKKTSEGGSTGGGGTATVTIADFGLENQAELTTHSSGDITLSFAQNDGTNGPKYYTSGTSARLYAKNSVTIKTAKKMSKVVLTCAMNGANPANGNNELYGEANGSKVTTKKDSDTQVSFSGFSSTELKIVNDFTDVKAGTQLRIVSIEITYAN